MDFSSDDCRQLLKNIENECCLLAVKAGNKIMEIYEDETLFNSVEYKDDNSPLTMADKLANYIIVSGLKNEFRNYAILSEEEKDDLERLENDFCFIVDPLDGTKEFIKRNGQFTVNIALSFKGESVVGVIYVPATEDLYYSSRENGAYLKTPDGVETKLCVSKTTDLSKVKLVMSGSHGCDEMEALIKKYNFTNFAKMGSSLKGCLVAKGDAEIYYRHNPTMEWDTAAMQCIVEESGGIFRQMDHSPMLYNREDSLNAKGFYIINSEENLLEQ